MKLCFNRNFSGYHWYEIDAIESLPGSITIESEMGANSEHKILSFLAMSGNYNSVLIKDNNKIILAIKGIKDSYIDTNGVIKKREDEQGRTLNMGLMLVAESTEFDLLHKIMLYALSETEKFNVSFSTKFVNEIDKIKCDIKGINEMFEEISKMKIKKSANRICKLNVEQTDSLYCIISNYQASTIATSLFINESDIQKAICRLDSINGSLLTIDAGDSIEELKERLNKAEIENSSLQTEINDKDSKIGQLKRKIEGLKQGLLPSQPITIESQIKIGDYIIPIYYIIVIAAIAGLLIGTIITNILK